MLPSRLGLMQEQGSRSAVLSTHYDSLCVVVVDNRPDKHGRVHVSVYLNKHVAGIRQHEKNAGCGV
jgi:hypothetical protein